MTAPCPNGHDSEWPDWCSICGERLAGADQSEAAASVAGTPVAATPDAGLPDAEAPQQAAASAPASSGPTCSNCGEPRHEHDVFCESCGYDFASGSLPEGATQPDAAATDDAAAPAVPVHVRVSIDPDFFAASIGDVELTLPDPLPEVATIPLAGSRILIGRKSTSRGIFPEIDARSLTGDPAVSSRHAMLERAHDGSWTFTDLGSTNGSYLDAGADEAVESGQPIDIEPGATIFVGAWTRIDLAES